MQHLSVNTLKYANDMLIGHLYFRNPQFIIISVHADIKINQCSQSQATFWGCSTKMIQMCFPHLES